MPGTFFLLLLTLSISLHALPDSICSSGYFFDSIRTICAKCRSECGSNRPVQLCPCTSCSDVICGSSCPSHTHFDSTLKRCVDNDLVNCTWTDELTSCDGACYRNVTSKNTSSNQLCVCSSSSSTCDLVLHPLRENWCPDDIIDAVIPTPTGPIPTVGSASYEVTDSLNGAVIGVIVAVACVGIVVVATAVILVVGISLHNRFVIWGQIRELRQLRREREERERRRDAQRRRTRNAEIDDVDEGNHVGDVEDIGNDD